MTCLLDAAIQVPDMPDGWTIRSVLGESEAAAIAALHRAAFGTEHMTTERRLQMMRTQWYDPRLDLVAIAPDGTLAAYALGQVGGAGMEPGMSYADLFATHPSYRGQRLANVLMHSLLHRLQACSATAARLSTDSDNQAMQHVANTAGFQVTGMTLRFQRAVHGDGRDW